MVTLTTPLAVNNVIAAVAVSFGWFSEAAVRVTAVFAGGVAGAVYVTAVLDAPDSAPQLGAQLFPDWLSVHDTPGLDASLLTCAENFSTPDGFNDAFVGDTATETAGVIVIFAEAVFVAFEIELAVNVTVVGLGALPGAE